MSGHSRWAQVKHKKAITDAKKGALFSKLVREITVAARSGGPNPDFNSRLKTAVHRAHQAGVPKDNVERAVERASGGSESAKLQEFLYEVSGPGNTVLLIEGITDNKNRTLPEIKKILFQEGARLADSGSLIWGFEKIGIIGLSFADQKKAKDEVEFTVIDAGARDFEVRGDMILVETLFEERDAVRQALEERGVKIKEASYDYKAKSRASLPVEDKARVEKLIENLYEHPDVQEVYTNLKND